MNKMMLAASAAILALASPALAQGKGHGGDHGNNHGNSGHGPAMAQHGGGHGGGHGERARMAMPREGGHGNVQGLASRAERGHGPRAFDVKLGKAEQGARPARGDERAHGAMRVAERFDGRDRRDELRFGDEGRARGLSYGLSNGCPPGLAMKNNGCLPPGQAKKLVGAAVPAGLASAMLEGPYRNWYRDDDRYYYRMGDGVIYRVARDNNLVSGLLPAFDQPYSYLPLGGYYPSDYNYYNVPYQYQQYYPDGGDALYRYANGAIYGLDAKTMAIQSIVALLAGDLSVGQRLPSTYSVYNVPMAYRSQYYDTPDNWYRYNDGYVYRVDPKTQLITAVIDALV